MDESTLTPPKLPGVYLNSSIIYERGSNKNKPSIGLRAVSFQLRLTKFTKGLWHCFRVNLSSLRTYESGQCSPNGWDYIHTMKIWFKPLHTPYLTPTLNLNTWTLLEQTPMVNTPPINLLRWMYVIWLLILISHLYMSGIWLSLVPKMDTKRHMLNNNWIVCSKYNKHSNSIVNNIWKKHIWSFNKHENWYWFRCSLHRLQKLWEKGLQPQFCFF